MPIPPELVQPPEELKFVCPNGCCDIQAYQTGLGHQIQRGSIKCPVCQRQCVSLAELANMHTGRRRDGNVSDRQNF